jgi:catalase
MRFAHSIVVDFEQPRALYTRVMSDSDRQCVIQNLAGHLGACKSAEIKARQRMSLPLSHPNFSGRCLTPL